MPDAMRWLWKGYPEPIKVAPNPVEPRRLEVLLPGANWELVSSGHDRSKPRLAMLQVKYSSAIRAQAESTAMVWMARRGSSRNKLGRVTGMSFGPDGKLYACQSGRRRIVRYTDAGQEEVVYADTTCQDIVTGPKGFYYSDPVAPGVWYSDYRRHAREG